MVTSAESNRARQIVNKLRQERRQFSNVAGGSNRPRNEHEYDYDKVGLDIMTNRGYCNTISEIDEDSFMHGDADDSFNNGGIHSASPPCKQSNNSFESYDLDEDGCGGHMENLHNSRGIGGGNYENDVESRLSSPNNSIRPEFECVMNASNGFYDEDDDESNRTPPPPPPLPPRFAMPKMPNIKMHWPKRNQQESLSSSGGGHNGAMLLETFDRIEASDERVTTATTTLHSGEQARVTLVPNAGKITPYAGFQDDRLFYHWGDSANTTSRQKYERGSRRMKRLLAALACLLLALSALVMILGFQEIQEENNEVNTVTAAATTSEYTSDTTGDKDVVATSPPTPYPTPAQTPSPTECVNSLSLEMQCYSPGQSITIQFNNCDPQGYDWVGLYRVVPYDLNENGMPEPLDWLFHCGSQNCIGVPTVTGEVTFEIGILPVGTYKAFLFRDKDVAPYPSIVSSEQELLISSACG